MPTLKQKETKKINLVSIPDAELEIYTSFNAGDVETILKEDLGFIGPAKQLIKSWNLTGESGTPLKINAENIRQLDVRDIHHIITESGINPNDFLEQSSAPEVTTSPEPGSPKKSASA